MNGFSGPRRLPGAGCRHADLGMARPIQEELAVPRRPIARWLAPLVALSLPWLAPALVRADGMTSTVAYRLINTSSATLDHAFFDFEPPGAVASPLPGHGPLTILDASPGVDVTRPDAGLIDYQKTAGGPTSQALGLDFQGTNFAFLDPSVAHPAPAPDGGLGAGQYVDFALTLNSPLASPFQLSLLPGPGSNGLQLLTYTPPGAAESLTPPGGTVNTPEPISLALWSTLAVAALGRAHLHRRSVRRAGSA